MYKIQTRVTNLVVLLHLAMRACTGYEEKSYVKVRVPAGYFMPIGDTGLPAQQWHKMGAECALACTMDSKCEAFKSTGQTCQVGSVNTTRPYFPSYVMDGDTIMIESEKVALNDVSAPYIGSIYSAPLLWSADNKTTFSMMEMPQYPNRQSGKPLFANAGYKGGIIACGGEEGSTTLKSRWFWSFAEGAWRLLPGELFHGHFVGKLVVVQDRLWMFMGRQTRTGNPHKKVESYDLKIGKWKEEDDADVEHGVDNFEAAVFDQTKVSK